MATPSLSVLIPNFNWDVTDLVKSLHSQLIKTTIDFEILVSDNALDSEYSSTNEKLNSLQNVSYSVNKEQNGRAQNRNGLARAAKYQLLLFLDGDAGLAANPDLISNYLKAFQPNTVICGGTAYGQPPKDGHKMLRYAYGKSREELPPVLRQQNAWAGFSAFNFLIERQVFLQFGFDEKMSKYGHEDTLFGNELKYRCINIIHINNPAEHLGLDSSEVFLAKSRQAVENLRDLINKGLVDEDVKLYAWFSKLRKTRMTAIIGSLYIKFKGKWEANLCGPNPSLRLFDLYRLSYLCTLPIAHRTAPPAKI
jgi:glycosyltransferase involved in cell wall biosynthesis